MNQRRRYIARSYKIDRAFFMYFLLLNNVKNVQECDARDAQ